MSLEAYWRQFGWCPVCEQTALQPCFDQRYARGNRVFFADKAHRERERVASPETP